MRVYHLSYYPEKTLVHVFSKPSSCGRDPLTLLVYNQLTDTGSLLDSDTFILMTVVVYSTAAWLSSGVTKACTVCLRTHLCSNSNSIHNA